MTAVEGHAGTIRSVTVGFFFRVGSRNEPHELNGITHFIEHSVFKGTRRRTAKQIAFEQDRLGGNLDAFTTHEETGFAVKVLDEQLPAAFPSGVTASTTTARLKTTGASVKTLSLGLAAVAAGRLTLATLVAALSTRPAAVIGEARGLDIGASADLAVFDAAARWRVEESALASVSSNTPLLDMDLPGGVRLTVADGRITYRG